ncbi:MAG: carboxylating nicotinate-nucleotide diphosphorylase [Acidimicrobiia bacterium]|nr:MAG: carboxylating nicotinate-nucleotide diphosphorylase [Acidimicrobiia bacterium]
MTAEIPASATETIARAYEEDLADIGDVTTLATIPQDHRSVATIIARSSGCMAGIPIVTMCFAHIDAALTVTRKANDGDMVDAGTVVVEAAGSTRSLLTAERVALNLFGRLSGVATATRAFVDAVDGTGTVISDTRKTTPGLRSLEKYAVAIGGGVNHRMGLYDAVMIKDNHLLASESIADAVTKARALVGTGMLVEIEVDTLDQLTEAVNTDADVVLLDNMTSRELREAVRIVNGSMRTEASGGVTLETVREIAETGVDVISVGWLTHSAPALDVAMDLETVDEKR